MNILYAPCGYDKRLIGRNNCIFNQLSHPPSLALYRARRYRGFNLIEKKYRNNWDRVFGGRRNLDEFLVFKRGVGHCSSDTYVLKKNLYIFFVSVHLISVQRHLIVIVIGADHRLKYFVWHYGVSDFLLFLHHFNNLYISIHFLPCVSQSKFCNQSIKVSAILISKSVKIGLLTN